MSQATEAGTVEALPAVLSFPDPEEVAFLEIAEFSAATRARAFGLELIKQTGPQAGARSSQSRILQSERTVSPFEIVQKLDEKLSLNCVRSSDTTARVSVKIGKETYDVSTCALQQTYDRRIGYLWILTSDNPPQGMEVRLSALGLKVESTIIQYKRLSLYHASQQYAPRRGGYQAPFDIVGFFITHSISPNYLAIWEPINGQRARYTGYRTVFTSDGCHLSILTGVDLVGHCFETGKVLRADDLHNGEEIRRQFGGKFTNRELATGRDLHSAWFVPVKRANSVIAVVAMYFRRPYGATNVELEMLETILGVFSYAISYNNDIAAFAEIKKRYERFLPKIRRSLMMAETLHSFKDEIVSLRNKLSLISPRKGLNDKHSKLREWQLRIYPIRFRD